jgi:hypothetical protein
VNPRPVIPALLRVVIAALAGSVAGIHLELWNGEGYRHIPTIGPLFLLNGVAGALLALASLAVPRRIVPLAWAAIAGYAGATLAALVVSLNGGLFGFVESTGAPLFAPSIGVETAAVLVGAGAAIWQVVSSRRPDGQGL